MYLLYNFNKQVIKEKVVRDLESLQIIFLNLGKFL
jgi:hypothetical protein